MPTIRPARTSDAPAIAAVHVAAWRSTYAGLLPASYLAAISTRRNAAYMRAAIGSGHCVLVAEAESAVVAYASLGPSRAPGLADGEVETLYVLDDYRDQGIGRALLAAAAERLDRAGCESLFLWVLEQNAARWFYARLGGRIVQRGTARVAGREFPQLAYRWAPLTPSPFLQAPRLASPEPGDC